MFTIYRKISQKSHDFFFSWFAYRIQSSLSKLSGAFLMEIFFLPYQQHVCDMEEGRGHRLLTTLAGLFVSNSDEDIKINLSPLESGWEIIGSNIKVRGMFLLQSTFLQRSPIGGVCCNTKQARMFNRALCDAPPPQTPSRRLNVLKEEDIKQSRLSSSLRSINNLIGSLFSFLFEISFQLNVDLNHFKSKAS